MLKRCFIVFLIVLEEKEGKKRSQIERNLETKMSDINADPLAEA